VTYVRLNDLPRQSKSLLSRHGSTPQLSLQNQSLKDRENESCKSTKPKKGMKLRPGVASLSKTELVLWNRLLQFTAIPVNDHWAGFVISVGVLWRASGGLVPVVEK
jgi:hypothetical protein